MKSILDFLDDENENPSVTITDTDGVTATYDFLDIICLDGIEYAVLCDESNDGYVDIFRIIFTTDGECYKREADEKILDKVFAKFKDLNEDEFDFD